MVGNVKSHIFLWTTTNKGKREKELEIDMDFKQAREKLDSVSNSAATKHPKILVAELCVVVKFLLDELDRIKSPIFTKLSKRLPKDMELGPRIKPSYPDKPEPQFPHRRRMGNAGDAQ